ncbi:MAG: hypothetical protein P1P84_14905 [Deferrisomatales bacterium]|nr:hypothetical protein [Deferrisomatales bacterium]
MAQKNCWEAIRCGREPGGSNCKVLGVCPAATETRLDGINGGRNGGRSCWAVPGTQIGWEPTATGVPKAFGCLHCSFLRKVEEEGGVQFSFLTDATRRLGLLDLNSLNDPSAPLTAPPVGH